MDPRAPLGRLRMYLDARDSGSRRCAGRTCGKLSVVGSCFFGGGGEPDHFKDRLDGQGSACSEKLEGADVAAEATMIGRVVRFAFRHQGAKLGDGRHAQQEHDQQCSPVVVDLTHSYSYRTVYQREPQHSGYQNGAATGNGRQIAASELPISLCDFARGS
jgi:hypothetical protein